MEEAGEVGSRGSRGSRGGRGRNINFAYYLLLLS